MYCLQDPEQDDELGRDKTVKADGLHDGDDEPSDVKTVRGERAEIPVRLVDAQTVQTG